MSTEIISGALGELRAASTAGGGTALSTTAALVQIPDGAHHLFLTTRNYSTAVVVKVALNPYLIVLKTADDLATVVNYSQVAQDGLAGTDVTLSSLGTAAQGDYLYVGSHLPFRGVSIDVDAANGTASIVTVNYWDGDSWADTSATDGTASGGAAMAIDGVVTWTVPADWAQASLTEIASPAPARGTVGMANAAIYWTRWQFSAALDSSTTLNSLLALSRSTAYFEMVAGQALEQRITKGPGGVGCVEALTDAGTANLIVNVAGIRGRGFI